MNWDFHPKESKLSRALYVIRLRHPDGNIAGRWRRTSVSQRREDNERAWGRLKPEAWHPKPWQPAHGRESPREDWMGWRRFMDAYSYPGCVGAKLKLIAMDNARLRREYGSSYPPRKLFTPRSRLGV